MKEDLTARAREIAATLRLSHHIAAKDAVVYLAEGPSALAERLRARGLKGRTNTRAAHAVWHKLEDLGIGHAQNPELRRAVAAVLTETRITSELSVAPRKRKSNESVVAKPTHLAHDFDEDGVCNRCSMLSEMDPVECPGWPDAENSE